MRAIVFISDFFILIRNIILINKDHFMIDTVVLLLTQNMFQISDPDKFKPSARWALHENTHRTFGLQSKQNPTQKELREGIYKPHLTLSHRINAAGTNEITLKIELSLPKLFFGNNFNELQLKDFPLLINQLVATLKDMRVITTPVVLAQAPVSAVPSQYRRYPLCQIFSTNQPSAHPSLLNTLDMRLIKSSF